MEVCWGIPPRASHRPGQQGEATSGTLVSVCLVLFFPISSPALGGGREGQCDRQVQEAGWSDGQGEVRRSEQTGQVGRKKKGTRGTCMHQDGRWFAGQRKQACQQEATPLPYPQVFPTILPTSPFDVGSRARQSSWEVLSSPSGSRGRDDGRPDVTDGPRACHGRDLQPLGAGRWALGAAGVQCRVCCHLAVQWVEALEGAVWALCTHVMDPIPSIGLRSHQLQYVQAGRGELSGFCQPLQAPTVQHHVPGHLVRDTSSGDCPVLPDSWGILSGSFIYLVSPPSCPCISSFLSPSRHGTIMPWTAAGRLPNCC